eukprot:527989_1
MGNKVNKPKKQTDETHKQIEALMRQAENKRKITREFILYGINSSGKTTILKTLNARYNKEMTLSPNIACNIQSQCVNNMIKLCTMFEEEKAANILKQFDIHNVDHLSNICTNMHNIWQKTDIKSHYQNRYITTQCNMDIIDENMDYFFDKIQEIMTDQYVPTKTDIIYHKTISRGITDYCEQDAQVDKFGKYTFKYSDLGRYTQNMSHLIKKRKMRHIFEDAAGLIFVVSLPDYCNQTRMLKSIEEFMNIVKSFDNKAIWIFFNKYKIFKECLRKGLSLRISFSEYNGNEYISYLLLICVCGVVRNIQKRIDNIIPDIVSELIRRYSVEEMCLTMEKETYFQLCEEDAVKYIASRYLNVFETTKVRLSSPLHIFRTNAVDGDQLDKLFKDMKLDIIKLCLKVAS